ncbi:hypothetical protein PHET_07217 [Paragonimus heterotremus]|uniref:CortBP2/NAV1-like AAA+ ATPase lid domain-containing protein n=1 Tax=Paragonimus heterotremus TaxID=100268 RepID=A0A8J4SW03_9TREM|nr:hypothetical protein PHET_07217 [Paragonimus heterotremus]
MSLDLSKQQTKDLCTRRSSLSNTAFASMHNVNVALSNVHHSQPARHRIFSVDRLNQPTENACKNNSTETTSERWSREQSDPPAPARLAHGLGSSTQCSPFVDNCLERPTIQNTSTTKISGSSGCVKEIKICPSKSFFLPTSQHLPGLISRTSEKNSRSRQESGNEDSEDLEAFLRTFETKQLNGKKQRKSRQLLTLHSPFYDKVNNLDPKTGWTNRRFTGSKWTRTPSPCVASKSLRYHSATKERTKTSSPITTVYGFQSNAQSMSMECGKDKCFKSPLDPETLTRQEMASKTSQMSCRKHSTRLTEPEIPVPVSSGYIRFKIKDEEPPCAVVLPMLSRSDHRSTTVSSQDKTRQDVQERKPVCTNPVIKLQAACELVSTVVPVGKCKLINTSSDKLTQKETTTEKNVQMMTSKIHQLTTMNELKDTEIYELHNTVNQLRADMHRLQLIQEAGSAHHKPTLPLLQQQLLRPPRSPSYRGVLENATPQELMDTMSLSSLTSAASTGSQDTGCTTATRAGPERSPTPSRAQQADSEPGSGKRSRWVRPSLGKAFKKRSRSSMDSGDRDGDLSGAARSVSSSSGSTATVLTSPGGPWTSLTQSNEKITKSSHSLEIASPQLETNDDVHDLLMKMRWEMHCLEADNHRLRRLVFNSPHLAEPQDVIDRVPQNSVDLSIPVFVDTDFRLTSGVESVKPVEQMASVEGLHLGNEQVISNNPGKLVRIGRVGIKPNSSWCDLDCDMANLFEDYIRFIDPDKRLGLEPIKMTAYQLRCYTSGGPNSSNRTRSVLRFRSETSRTDMLFKPVNKELETTLPKVWVERGKIDGVDGNIEMLIILCLSPVQHMKLDATGDHESDLQLLAFETLLPVNDLRAYQSVVHTHRFSVLCGPTGTGKSKIVRKMAASIWRNSGKDNEAISKFSIKPNGSSTVEDILSFVEDSLDVNSQKDVMVLENLHNIHGAVEQLVEALFRKYSEARLTILATSDFRNKEMDSLQEKGMVRVLNHLSDIDDTTEFLACYLRRKLVQTRLAELNNTEVQMQLGGRVHDQQILTQLISWIPKVWKYLNRLFLSSLQTQCPTVISLRVFLSCPIDVRASRKWFTDLWNNLFIPFLFRARSTEQMLQSQSMALSASLDWIMATWPWPRATTDLMLQTPYMSHSSTNPLHSLAVEGSPSSPSDCCLNTFGVPKSNPTVQKQRGLENRSSLDSGIVPDGYSTMNVNVGASNLHCETQPFTESDLSERLTVNHLLAEVRNSEVVSREAIGYMMTNLTSHV